MELVARLGAAQLQQLAAHLRIVMVTGPRQAGKTTLLTQYLDRAGGSYRTLDRPEVRQAAVDDPPTFVAYGDLPRGIDEVQLGGDPLVRAIKVAVDEDPRPGQFILSGSSRFLTIPTLSESLAGRVAFIELWPLSMAERTSASADVLERLFADPVADQPGWRPSPWGRDEYLDCIVAGGYPELLRIPTPIARRAWYDGYLSTVINRDIRDFATVARADAIGTLLRLVAARAGGIAVLTDLAQGAELARDTARSYLSYLDLVFLTISVPAWSAGATSRLTKSPKLFVSDSGLAAHLLDIESGSAIREPGHAALGPLLETFVATELRKAVAHSSVRARLFQLRTVDQREIDFMLEGPGGRLVAIEVKASTSPGADALRNLRWGRERFGDRLVAGILLHLGQHASSHGDRIHALPLSVLWDNRRLPR